MNRYIEEYKSKMTTVEGLADLVETGDYCYVDMAQGAPHVVLNAVAERVKRKEITGIRLYSLLDVAPIDCYRFDLGDGMRGTTGFSGGFARSAVNHGYADVFPCYYRDIPGIIREYGKVNVENQYRPNVVKTGDNMEVQAVWMWMLLMMSSLALILIVIAKRRIAEKR